MQKVITIYSVGTDGKEVTYSKLDSLLSDGYKVKQVLSASSENVRTTVTLLLEKDS